MQNMQLVWQHVILLCLVQICAVIAAPCQSDFSSSKYCKKHSCRVHCSSDVKPIFIQSKSKVAKLQWLQHWSVNICRTSFTFVVMLRLAPWSSRAAATSLCPSLAARCRGVYPELVVASGHAPFVRSCCTMSGLPRRLEMCSGVWSSCSKSRDKQKSINAKKAPCYFIVFSLWR